MCLIIPAPLFSSPLIYIRYIKCEVSSKLWLLRAILFPTQKSDQQFWFYIFHLLQCLATCIISYTVFCSQKTCSSLFNGFDQGGGGFQFTIMITDNLRSCFWWLYVYKIDDYYYSEISLFFAPFWVLSPQKSYNKRK